MTKVVHLKQPYDVLICRPSKWGNPYSHKKGTRAEFIVGSRKEAIEAYRKWITEGDGMHLLDDLHELKDKKIACWCAPLACHGDVLAELADQANDPYM